MTSYGDLKFSPDSLRNGSRALQEVIDFLMEKTDQLFDQVGDSLFLGKNDMLGEVASMLYEAAVEVAKQCIRDLLEEFLQHALKLGDAAEIYEQAEQENAQSGSSMVEGASWA